jgi:hypothetical protein
MLHGPLGADEDGNDGDMKWVPMGLTLHRFFGADED